MGLGLNLTPVAVSVTGNTAGTPSVISSGTVYLAGGPNVTLSQDGRTISISGPAAGIPSADSTKFVQANAVFAGTSASGTIASNGISVAVGPYITTARASNDAIGLNSALTANGVSVTANSAGLSLNFPAFLTTAALSNHSHGNPTLALTNLSGTTASASNGLTLSLSAAAPGAGAAVSISDAATSGTVGRLAFTNLNGVTLSLSTGADGSHTIVGSHNALTTARASNDAIGLNTALTANGVSVTANSAGLSLNFPAFLTTAALSNHSHGNPTLALTNLSGTTASNSAGFTLSLAAAAPGGGAGVNRGHMEIMGGDRMTTCAVLNNGTYSNRPVFVPFVMKEGASLSANTVQVFFSRSSGTVLLATLGVGFYTYANSTSINLLFSTTHNFSVQSSVSFSGIRAINFTGMGANVLTAGEYVFALYNSAAASNSCPLHVLGGDGFALAGYINTGSNQTAATHSQSHIIPMWGVWNATTAEFPAAVAFSSISGGMPSVNSPDIYAVVKE